MGRKQGTRIGVRGRAIVPTVGLAALLGLLVGVTARTSRPTPLGRSGGTAAAQSAVRAGRNTATAGRGTPSAPLVGQVPAQASGHASGRGVAQGGHALSASGRGRNPRAIARVTASPVSLDLDVAQGGDVVQGAVTFTNAGSAPAHLRRLVLRGRRTGSSGLAAEFTPTLGPLTLQPGASVELRAGLPVTSQEQRSADGL